MRLRKEIGGSLKEQLLNIFKRRWVLILGAILLLSFLLFREITIQLLLLIVVIAALGYVLYKSVIYLFVISSGIVKGLLSLVSFIIAIFIIVRILSSF